LKTLSYIDLRSITGGSFSNIICNISKTIRFNGQPLMRICPNFIQT